MKALQWYRMTHDNTGSRYGWIIGKEQGGSFIVYCKGYSRESFLAAAERIIGSAANPVSFLVINPAEKGTAYRLTNVFYAARHNGYFSIEKAFATA